MDEDIRKEKIAEVTGENNVAIDNPDEPLNEVSQKNILEMLKNVEGMVRVMESQWMASAKELGLKDSDMKQLAAINEKHKDPMPEHLTEEQKNEWDYLNGIDKITDEEIDEIFPEGHKVRGVDHSQTVDRIKGACQDFFGWVQVMSEYRNIHDAYLKLIEMEELKDIETLKAAAEKETDENKKAEMLKSVDMYFNRKYLGFLAEPIDEEDKNRILDAFSDEKKVAYWINRTRDKLNQLKVSSKFILECSQFEKRFLEEKYHKCSNILLLYFMNTCIYCSSGDKRDDARTKTVCMVMAVDAIIRKTWAEERINEVLDNIRALEDQFIDDAPEAAED